MLEAARRSRQPSLGFKLSATFLQYPDVGQCLRCSNCGALKFGKKLIHCVAKRQIQLDEFTARTFLQHLYEGMTATVNTF